MTRWCPDQSQTNLKCCKSK